MAGEGDDEFGVFTVAFSSYYGAFAVFGVADGGAGADGTYCFDLLGGGAKGV